MFEPSQDELNTLVLESEKIFAKELPSYIKGFRKEIKDGYVMLWIDNPFQPQNPLLISTMSYEITIWFDEGHVHLSPWEFETQEKIVNEMHTEVTNILTGKEKSYTAWKGAEQMGGGLEKSELCTADLAKTHLGATTFKLLAWNPKDNHEINLAHTHSETNKIGLFKRICLGIFTGAIIGLIEIQFYKFSWLHLLAGSAAGATAVAVLFIAPEWFFRNRLRTVVGGIVTGGSAAIFWRCVAPAPTVSFPTSIAIGIGLALFYLFSESAQWGGTNSIGTQETTDQFVSSSALNSDELNIRTRYAWKGEDLEAFACTTCGAIYIGIPDCHLFLTNPYNPTESYPYNLPQTSYCPKCKAAISSPNGVFRPRRVAHKELAASEWHWILIKK